MTANDELKARLAALESELAAMKAANAPKRREPQYGSWHVAAPMEPMTEAQLAEQAAQAERHALLPGEIHTRRLFYEREGELSRWLRDWEQQSKPPDLRPVQKQLTELRKAETERRKLPENARAVVLADAYEKHEEEERKAEDARQARIVAEAAREQLADAKAEIDRQRAALAADEAAFAQLCKRAESGA